MHILVCSCVVFLLYILICKGSKAIWIDARINIGAHTDVFGILKIWSVVNNKPPNLPWWLSLPACAMSPPPSGRVLSFNKLKVEAQFILVFPLSTYISWQKATVLKERISFHFIFLTKVKGNNQKTSVQT